MMNKRYKTIIDEVTKFRCLSRDQISELYFGHCRKPHTNANTALKRLRDRRYLTVAPFRQPYVYMINPAPIKRDSNKIDHYLAIADVYIALKKAGKVREFTVEPRYDDVEVRPDIFTVYQGMPLFIEVQKSVYSDRVMAKKFERYQAYYDSEDWRKLDWQPKGNPVFPYVLLFSTQKYRVETEGFKVRQYTDVSEFLRSLTVRVNVG
ncbi:replication-relaxation family protein [Alteribacter populi]|uniref:replication-relaxation family protein n=1 Tax=Alteribacter populi TaxID=2011011 RepID=UPI000BBB243B|nr:replication-relaxation family protein [Alteribacter populi]